MVCYEPGTELQWVRVVGCGLNRHFDAVYIQHFHILIFEFEARFTFYRQVSREGGSVIVYYYTYVFEANIAVIDNRKLSQHWSSYSRSSIQSSLVNC